LAHNQLLPKQSLGKNIVVHSEKGGIPDLEDIKIVIVGVNETRNATIKSRETLNLSSTRIELYKLFLGNWHTRIADLGDIKPGETIEDTYFALSQLVENLVNKGIIPVIIGGSQDLCYAVYRGFDKLSRMVNMV